MKRESALYKDIFDPASGTDASDEMDSMEDSMELCEDEGVTTWHEAADNRHRSNALAACFIFMDKPPFCRGYYWLALAKTQYPNARASAVSETIAMKSEGQLRDYLMTPIPECLSAIRMHIAANGRSS